jgi:hypothetical protein
MPAISQPEMRTDATAWTPSREGFELHDVPPDRADASGNNRPDDTGARPAWGMSIALVMLMLYVLGNSPAFTVYFDLYELYVR